MSTAERITKALGRKPTNLEALIKVLETYQANPDVKTDVLVERSGVPHASFYRCLRTLKEYDLLEDAPHERTFELPQGVLLGKMPPVRYSAVHLANYLTRFKAEEVVPPYGKTKQTIIDEFRKKMALDADLGSDVVFGLQEKLAQYAIFTGKLNSFEKMVGLCEPPEVL